MLTGIFKTFQTYENGGSWKPLHLGVVAVLVVLARPQHTHKMIDTIF